MDIGMLCAERAGRQFAAPLVVEELKSRVEVEGGEIVWYNGVV